MTRAWSPELQASDLYKSAMRLNREALDCEGADPKRASTLRAQAARLRTDADNLADAIAGLCRPA